MTPTTRRTRPPPLPRLLLLLLPPIPPLQPLLPTHTLGTHLPPTPMLDTATRRPPTRTPSSLLPPRTTSGKRLLSSERRMQTATAFPAPTAKMSLKLVTPTKRPWRMATSRTSRRRGRSMRSSTRRFTARTSRHLATLDHTFVKRHSGLKRFRILLLFIW